MTDIVIDKVQTDKHIIVAAYCYDVQYGDYISWIEYQDLDSNLLFRIDGIVSTNLDIIKIDMKAKINNYRQDYIKKAWIYRKLVKSQERL